MLITSIGVVSGVIGYFSRNELPRFTAIGAVYFALIIVVTWVINRTVRKIYTRKISIGDLVKESLSCNAE